MNDNGKKIKEFIMDNGLIWVAFKFDMDRPMELEDMPKINWNPKADEMLNNLFEELKSNNNEQI